MSMITIPREKIQREKGEVILSLKKKYKKLIKEIKEKAKEKEKIFRENPFCQTLKTHKLSGREKRILGFLDELFLLY